jgi:hypothetical protein
MYVAVMGVHGECGHACVVHMDFRRLQNTMVPTLVDTPTSVKMARYLIQILLKEK